MSRVATVNRRYSASASLVELGVDIVAVADPIGFRLNSAIRALINVAREDGTDLWNDLLGASRILRWRLLLQPQPIQFNPDVLRSISQVSHQVTRLRGTISDETVIDELLNASLPIEESEPIVANILCRSIEEVGAKNCVVVALDAKARNGIDSWLEECGVKVMTVGDLEREQPRIDQAYAIGPPRYFRSSLITAPVIDSLSFILPSWFSDHSIPLSPFAAYADGAINVKARIFYEGEGYQSALEKSTNASEEDFLPKIIWGNRQSIDRLPGKSEVVARKVILSGSMATWLDDGDRIRTFDPNQPLGDRVTNVEVSVVRKGTYLLLRKGETEHGVFYKTALDRLGEMGKNAVLTQIAWKKALRQRLEDLGRQMVASELQTRGVKAYDRSIAWVEPTLIRPNRDADFHALLSWLDIPSQPTFDYATRLRQELYQVSADVREQLENAFGSVDLTELERDGHVTLDLGKEGMRGMVATRVIEISPFSEIVPRYEARLVFEDRTGQWLE